jgi:hypothetical protein
MTIPPNTTASTDWFYSLTFTTIDEVLVFKDFIDSPALADLVKEYKMQQWVNGDTQFDVTLYAINKDPFKVMFNFAERWTVYRTDAVEKFLNEGKKIIKQAARRTTWSVIEKVFATIFWLFWAADLISHGWQNYVLIVLFGALVFLCLYMAFKRK